MTVRYLDFAHFYGRYTPVRKTLTGLLERFYERQRTLYACRRQAQGDAEDGIGIQKSRLTVTTNDALTYQRIIELKAPHLEHIRLPEMHKQLKKVWKEENAQRRYPIC